MISWLVGWLIGCLSPRVPVEKIRKRVALGNAFSYFFNGTLGNEQPTTNQRLVLALFQRPYGGLVRCLLGWLVGWLVDWLLVSEGAR